jgi:hypothetical protein
VRYVECGNLLKFSLSFVVPPTYARLRWLHDNKVMGILPNEWSSISNMVSLWVGSGPIEAKVCLAANRMPSCSLVCEYMDFGLESHLDAFDDCAEHIISNMYVSCHNKADCQYMRMR